MIVRADARRIPLADNSVQCVVTSRSNAIQRSTRQPKPFTISDRAGRMHGTHSGHWRSPSAIAHDFSSYSARGVLVLPKLQDAQGLSFFDTQKWQKKTANLSGLEVTRLVAKQRLPFSCVRFLRVIPSAQCDREKCNRGFIHHANLHTLGIAVIHAASKVSIRLRLLDSNVGFPVSESSEVSKNFSRYFLHTDRIPQQGVM